MIPQPKAACGGHGPRYDVSGDRHPRPTPSANLAHEPCQRGPGARQVIVPEGRRPALRGAPGGSCRLLNGPALWAGCPNPSYFSFNSSKISVGCTPSVSHIRDGPIDKKASHFRRGKAWLEPIDQVFRVACRKGRTSQLRWPKTRKQMPRDV